MKIYKKNPGMWLPVKAGGFVDRTHHVSGIFIMEKETWKTVPKFEDYQVSNLGRVRSKDNYVNTWNGKRFAKGRILKPDISYAGYRRVKLRRNQRTYRYSVARLVKLVFDPNIYHNSLEVNHLDGDKSNNKLSNLQWCTKSENEKHAFKNKLKIPVRGEKHPASKYSANFIRAVRNEYQSNPTISHQKLADKYGMDKRHVTDILNRKRWKHI